MLASLTKSCYDHVLWSFVSLPKLSLLSYLYHNALLISHLSFFHGSRGRIDRHDFGGVGVTCPLKVRQSHIYSERQIFKVHVNCNTGLKNGVF